MYEIGDGVLNAIHNQYQQRFASDADIYSGKVYQKHVASGFLADEANISFILNTDGIPVFKGSKYSFWPVFLLISELPYRMW